MTGAAWIWVVLVSLVLSGLFSSLHMSLRQVSRGAVEAYAARSGRPHAARRIARIFEDQEGHALALGLPRILMNLLALVGTVLWITSLRGAEAPSAFERAVGVVGCALLLWVFGFIVPYSVAKHAAERNVVVWWWLVRAVYLVALPLQRAVGFLDEVVRRLVGAERDQADDREAELLSVVEEGEREGQFDQAERDMIEAVVQLRERTVEQIMTPRTEVEALEYTDDVQQVVRFVRRTGHSRTPVYRENLDHVVGILYAKDLLGALAGLRDDEPFRLQAILREALFVPETKTVRELLADLVARKLHIAMVADEYGGTSGLVTLEDIVEEVFGEIWDEYEAREEVEAPSARVDLERRCAEADARMEIDDINAALEPLGVAIPEGEDYDTLGGFVITTLGRIPASGEHLRHGRMRLTVLSAQPTRVVRVRIDVLPDEEPAADGDQAAARATHRARA